jgi:preprotein translocase subunit SecE
MSLTSYLSETKSELRHVTWPSRAQALSYTLVVIGMSLVVGVLLGVFDIIFNVLLKLAF